MFSQASDMRGNQLRAYTEVIACEPKCLRMELPMTIVILGMTRCLMAVRDADHDTHDHDGDDGDDHDSGRDNDGQHSRL